MSVIMEEYGAGGKVSHTTVSDWMKTVGLALLKESRNDIKTSKMKYAFIIDESITIGSQKLLLVLAVPSEHPGHALTHKDVKVVGMFVAESWKSSTIAEKLKSIIADIVYDPVYVLSDNGHDLVKATEILNLIHHKDVSHTLGIFLKETYGGNAEFKQITEEMGQARLKYHLTKTAYLLPPNQRSICRFMNCFNWVEWGNRMIAKIDDSNGLQEEERLAFGFLKKHKAMFKELSCVMRCYKHVMKVVKNEGLSIKSYKNLRDYIVKEHIYPDNIRLTGLMVKVWGYLKEEVGKLKPNELAHNISSDIIESTFGVFKERNSPNKLYGITPFVLFIPAHAGVVGMHDCASIDFKCIFEKYHLKDTKEWKDENLLTNWVLERRNTLNSEQKISA